jgi:hypothetical protein
VPVAAKLTDDGVAWNAGPRAGIVVTVQFEKVVAELHVNDSLTPSGYESCGTTSNFSVCGNAVHVYASWLPVNAYVPDALHEKVPDAAVLAPEKRAVDVQGAVGANRPPTTSVARPPRARRSALPAGRRAGLILLNIDTGAPVHHGRAMEFRSIHVMRQRPAPGERVRSGSAAAFTR